MRAFAALALWEGGSVVVVWEGIREEGIREARAELVYVCKTTMCNQARPSVCTCLVVVRLPWRMLDGGIGR